MPPPGPCDASAALLHSTAAAIEITAGAARDIAVRVRNDVMEISIQKALSKIRRQSTPGLPRGKIFKRRRVLARVHVRGAFIQGSFKSPASDCVQRCGERFGADVDTRPKESIYAVHESSC